MVETVKSTPGPWTAEKNGGKGAWIKGANGEWSAMACGTDDENADANARLIAAAPDLLEALKVMIDITVGDIYSLDPAITAARKAIAKAEGRHP